MGRKKKITFGEALNWNREQLKQALDSGRPVEVLSFMAGALEEVQEWRKDWGELHERNEELVRIAKALHAENQEQKQLLGEKALLTLKEMLQGVVQTDGAPKIAAIALLEYLEKSA